MALPHDMTCLVYEFDMSVEYAASFRFQRWQGGSTVVGGVVIDEGYADFSLGPAWVFVPRVPKDQLDRIPVGNRHKSHCLVWSVARDAFGNVYDYLKTINQPSRARPDQIVDVDRDLTYKVVEQWAYDRQGFVSGAIGELIQT